MRTNNQRIIGTESGVKRQSVEPSVYSIISKNGSEPIQLEFPFATLKSTFPQKALYGTLGDITRLIAPQSEADPGAIYCQLLVAFGNCIRRKAFFQVEATKHYANLFLILVGLSSVARKGTSLDYAKKLFALVDITYVTQFASGLSTGEGLIWMVRDPAQRGKVADPGVLDKRLLVIESEFARVLKVMSRPNNILSSVMRDAWDSGDLRTSTKHESARATGAHISTIGHITDEELRKEMVDCDVFNGFANRFLWINTERSQLLPEGGKIDPDAFNRLAIRLKEAVSKAKSVEEMTRSMRARAYWATIYSELTSKRFGMLGAATSRAEAQVLRISMVLALTDGSAIIKLQHLKAALALWKYCFQSAAKHFGYRVKNLHAQKILDRLRQTPEGLTRSEISIDVFGRNLDGRQLGLALQELLDSQLASCKREPSSNTGRDAERWFVRCY